jgi:hypothetical protein
MSLICLAQISGQFPQVRVCQLVAALPVTGRPAVLTQAVKHPAAYGSKTPFDFPSFLARQFRQALNAQASFGGHDQA